MSFNFSLYQPYLAVLLPLVLPYLASGLASILAQDGFDVKSPLINDALAWAFLVVASVGSGIIDNQFLNTPDVAVNAIVSMATLLLAGPLTSLKPWINFTGFLQSRVFNVVKHASVNLAAQEAAGQGVQVGAVVTPDMLAELAATITTGLQGLFTTPQPVQRPQLVPLQPVQSNAGWTGTPPTSTPFPVPARPQLPQALPVVTPPPLPLPGNSTPTRHFGDSQVVPVVSPQ